MCSFLKPTTPPTQLTDPPVVACVNRLWYKTEFNICTNDQTPGESTTFISLSECCMDTDASSYSDTCNVNVDEAVPVPCPIPPTSPPVPPPQTEAPVSFQPMVSIFMNKYCMRCLQVPTCFSFSFSFIRNQTRSSS